MIPVEIIKRYPVTEVRIPENTFLFMEGDQAVNYYQIITGKVKMININHEGKEFVQGVFEDGQSFGEPPLFHNNSYPASARTTEPTHVYKLRKQEFINLLREHPDIHLLFTTILTKRLMYKAMMMKEISSHDAQHRIISFIDYLKTEYGDQETPFLVELTRQQLSNMLGIRVETVIRSIKLLADKGELILENRKLFR